MEPSRRYALCSIGLLMLGLVVLSQLVWITHAPPVPLSPLPPLPPLPPLAPLPPVPPIPASAHAVDLNAWPSRLVLLIALVTFVIWQRRASARQE